MRTFLSGWCRRLLTSILTQHMCGETGLLGASDRNIWNHAAEHGFLLVSKDTDFYERSIAFGAPPKIIWLRIGNCTVDETAALLRNQYIVVRHFAEDAVASFLPLTQLKKS